LPGNLSTRRRARILAERVIAELLADRDALEIANARLLAALPIEDAIEPAIALAHSADLDLHGAVLRERLARYEQRGGKQLSSEAYQAETRLIGAAMIERLADRFRRA